MSKTETYQSERRRSILLRMVGCLLLLCLSVGYLSAQTNDDNAPVLNRRDSIRAAKNLKEVVVSKKRPKYVRKGNPAIELAKNVIKHKNDNRIESVESYKSTNYKKLVLSFGRFTMDFQKNNFNRKLAFLEKYIDTLPPDTVPVLTISVRERLEDHYHRKSPRKDVIYVRARRMQGADESLDKEGLGTNLDAIFTEVNIFDNDIELMLNRFVSPLSSTIATTFYHYYITDTVMIDSVSCIELTFTPVNSHDYGFNGRMYIVNDSSYAVKRYIINIPHRINMNFVNQLVVEQEFMQTDSGLWAPRIAHTTASFSLLKSKKMRKIYAHQTTFWFGYETGVGIPDSLDVALSGEELVSPDVWKYKSGRWKEMRPLPLNPKESFIDSLGPELRRLPAFKALEKTAEILASGYIATAKSRKDSYFDIGSIYNMLSFNPAEGLRLRIGGMTTAKLHDQWFMNAYLAYGFKDRRLKYNVTMIHTFDKKKRHPYEAPRNGLTISTMYDMEMPGQQYTYMDRDNILLSYDNDTTAAAAQYVRRTKVHYQREWPSRLRFETWLQYENNEAAGSLAYWRINRDGSVTRVHDFNNLEWSIRLRWAPGETTIDSQRGDKKPFKLSKDAPVLILTHTFGILSGDLQYNKTDLSVEKRFWLSTFGHIDATLQAGIVWDAVPYTKLYIPQNSQSLFMMPNTFCLMKPMEFLMDKYVALYATYYIKRLIFIRIPYWNRLNLREVVSFSGIYGGLSPKNIPGPNTPGLYLLPDGCGQLGKVPYMEITAGIENIFEFLRIDYVRRISYAKNLKGWDKNGIRFTFRVSF
ncbi:MAG: carboxypeptidase-like regulatory domain-containing protein [Bacteroidales bacterium]|nr:carboxypeptidase-like regulatory domain-containing protein [Bacteroidales bacterium]